MVDQLGDVMQAGQLLKAELVRPQNFIGRIVLPGEIKTPGISCHGGTGQNFEKAKLKLMRPQIHHEIKRLAKLVPGLTRQAGDQVEMQMDIAALAQCRYLAAETIQIAGSVD